MRLSARLRAVPWHESSLPANGRSNPLKNWRSPFLLTFLVDTHSEFTVYTRVHHLAARSLQCSEDSQSSFLVCSSLPAACVTARGSREGVRRSLFIHKEAVL